jgi:gas vesicle protein
MAEQSNDSGYAKGFIIGAIIGSAIGSITALLLAPKTGKELRDDLAQKSTEIYDKASTYFNTMEENIGTAVTTTVNEGKVKAQNIINSAKKQAETILENADQIMQDARSKAGEAKDVISNKLGNIKDAVKAGTDAFHNEINS